MTETLPRRAIVAAAIAANPLLGFFLRAEETGMVELEWTDDGTIHRSSHRLNVAG